MNKFRQMVYLAYKVVLRPVLGAVVVLGTLITIASLASRHWEIAVLFGFPIALLVACLIPSE